MLLFIYLFYSYFADLLYKWCKNYRLSETNLLKNIIINSIVIIDRFLIIVIIYLLNFINILQIHYTSGAKIIHSLQIF